jgi:hypothetical protein
MKITAQRISWERVEGVEENDLPFECVVRLPGGERCRGAGRSPSGALDDAVNRALRFSAQKGKGVER